MAAPLLDPTTDYTRRLIQRWIGAEESGNLNDVDTVAELLKDVVGLHEYLKTRPPGGIPVATPVSTPLHLPSPPLSLAPGIRTYPEVTHTTRNMGGSMKSAGVAFHSTYGAAAGSLSWIKNPTSKVSYHVLIFPDGTRHNVVPLDVVAWHAGVSSFRGRSGCNAFLAGVAFEGDLYRRDLTPDERASAVEFIAKHKAKYGWTEEWITDHRTIAPNRKVDVSPPSLQTLRNDLKPIW